MRNLLSLISIFLALVLSSCSITDVASTLLPSTNKPSIEANVAIGKTNVQDKALVGIKGEDNRQIADDIVNTTNTSTKAETINNSNISLIYLVLLILGWLLPSPSEIWRGILSLFGRS